VRAVRLTACSRTDGGLTLRTGQCHVQRYMEPLLRRTEIGQLDPPRVIAHAGFRQGQ
jgi:threonine dehydrogenase-like Zn-dependent dehydrogenase